MKREINASKFGESQNRFPRYQDFQKKDENLIQNIRIKVNSISRISGRAGLPGPRVGRCLSNWWVKIADFPALSFRISNLEFVMKLTNETDIYK